MGAFRATGTVLRRSEWRVSRSAIVSSRRHARVKPNDIGAFHVAGFLAPQTGGNHAYPAKSLYSCRIEAIHQEGAFDLQSARPDVMLSSRACP